MKVMNVNMFIGKSFLTENKDESRKKVASAKKNGVNHVFHASSDKRH